MKRAIKRLGTAGLLGLGVLALGACDDGVLTENPPHIIVADNLYTDLAGFQAGVNALYAEARVERQGLSGSPVNELASEMMTVGVDNAYSNYPAGLERIWNDWGVLNNPQQGHYLDVWSWLYKTINAANTVIGRAENPDVNWTQEDHDRIVAEARFFRAWAYRHLTYLWGDVPLALEESSGESVRTDWERAPRAEVRKQMEQDLLFAEEHLPATAEDGRLTKAVAEHYLAELYLAMDEPAKAEEKAKAVIDSGLYHLVTDRYGANATKPGSAFMDQFQDGNSNRSEGNTEVLWSFQYQNQVAGGGTNIMRRYWVNRYYNLKGIAVSAENGGRAIGRLANTRWSIENYEPQDDRGSIYAIRKFYLYNDPASLPAGKELGDTLYLSWTKEKGNDPRWPSTRKWDWADPNNVSGEEQYEDQPYLRLAETYLLLAEAQFKQGHLDDAAATLNVVRERSHASPITAGDVTLDFILDERSRELLTEEERRYTLLRTHTWLERTQKYNPLAGPNITPRDTVFPIPQAVIDANIGKPMAQNPGY